MPEPLCSASRRPILKFKSLDGEEFNSQSHYCKKSRLYSVFNIKKYKINTDPYFGDLYNKTHCSNSDCSNCEGSNRDCSIKYIK